MNTPLPSEMAWDSSLIPTMSTVAALAWRYRSAGVKDSAQLGVKTRRRSDTVRNTSETRTRVSQRSVRFLILAMLPPILELAGSCSAESLQIRRVLNVQLFVYDPRLMREATRGPDSEPIEYRNSLTCYDDA